MTFIMALSETSFPSDQVHAFLSSLNLDSSHNLQVDVLKETLSLLNEPLSEGNLKMLQTILSEIRQSIKTFQPYADIRKVCIFGSARTPDTDANYQFAEAVSKKLSESGFMIITGAGPGIMEAGNKGALANRSFGLNILLPFEQEPNRYIKDNPKLVSYKYFFTRKLFFIKQSDATLFFPGGFGTHDEGFELFTLLQTGRCSPRPMLLCSAPNDSYWHHWVDFIQSELCDKLFISQPDTHLFKICHTVDDVLHHIQHFFLFYHSIRYLEDYAVIRLNKALDPKCIDFINASFSFILKHGKFEQVAANTLHEEANLWPEKPRLIFPFNQKDYSVLCQIIASFY